MRRLIEYGLLDGLESGDDASPISELLQKVEKEIKEVADQINPPAH